MVTPKLLAYMAISALAICLALNGAPGYAFVLGILMCLSL